MREGDVRLVIADPSADGSSCAESLLEIREEFPSTLISIYTVSRAPVVRSLLELAGRGVKDVVLYQTDDTRARFAELVDRAAARPLTTAVIGLLAAPLSQLPGNLAAAIDVLFASPRRVRTVDDLAVVAHMTRRSVYRHLATAGIRSPRLLVSAARVTKAASLLAQPGRTVCEVAKALGYSKPELLSAQLRTLTGLRPRELRDRSHLREVPEMVAMRLLASQGESGVVPDAHE
ncbi:MAG: helix-turn-helix domain-containing protein [Gemmatimonadaceae bacterium]